MKKLAIVLVFSGACSMHAIAQKEGSIKINDTLYADADVVKKATEWSESLALNNETKQKAVFTTIATHVQTVKNWHNEHPYTTVPAGINPATGQKLSNQDRQVIATSAMPATVHENLMKGLRAELPDSLVEKVLDKYTIGKVAFTLQGYKAIVPDLTAKEEEVILGHLKQAHEQAVDFKNMKEISAIFEIYKTKCEQYLNSNGRNWRQLFSDYVKQRNAEKAAEKAKKEQTKTP